MQTYQIHEVANIFPLMSEDEYQGLLQDIKANGLREAIWLYEDKIIDGRNRYKACRETGVEPRFREWDGVGSLVSFVVSLNLQRRNLTPEQKAAVAIDMLPLLKKEAKERQLTALKQYNTVQEIVPEREPGQARDHAAKLTGANSHYVTDANKLKNETPEVFDALKAGKVNIPTAKKIAELPAEKQQEVTKAIANVDKAEAKNIVNKAVTDNRTEQKKQEMDTDGAYKAQARLSDCLEWLDSAPSCDLLITDPPYSTDVDDISTFASTWLPKALGKVKSTGRAYICVGAYPDELLAYLQAPREHMILAQVLVWTYRNTMGPTPKLDYKNNWQAILYFRGEDAPPLNCPELNELFSVQDINAPDGRQFDRHHAWQKPDELAYRLIRHSTEKDAVVCDPFCGTGTFLLAAAHLKRDAYGCDSSPEMLEIAKQRGVVINEQL